MIKQMEKHRKEVKQALKALPGSSVPAVKDGRKPRKRKPKTLVMRDIEQNLGPYLKQRLAEVSGLQYSEDIRPAIIEYVLAMVACGKSIAQLCAEEGRYFPSPEIIFNWIMRDQDLAAQYRTASENSVEARVDSLANMVENDPDTEKTKLAVRFVQWYAAKKLPKTYGETRHLQIDQNTNVNMEGMNRTDLSAEEAARIYADQFIAEE